MPPAYEPPRYREWLDFFFDRTEQEAAFESDWWFKAEPETLADLLTHTLRNSGRDLDRFSDRQVAAGLCALHFGHQNDIPYEVVGPHVPPEKVSALLGSFWPLYRDCLDRRAPPVLAHMNETQGHPLEFFTYMLWDARNLDYVASKNDEWFPVLLQVWKQALTLSNPACVESALHGLGHSVYRREAESVAVIDAWLNSNPAVRPELIRYARAARTGRIQ